MDCRIRLLTVGNKYLNSGEQFLEHEFLGVLYSCFGDVLTAKHFS